MYNLKPLTDTALNAVSDAYFLVEMPEIINDAIITADAVMLSKMSEEIEPGFLAGSTQLSRLKRSLYRLSKAIKEVSEHNKYREESTALISDQTKHYTDTTPITRYEMALIDNHEDYTVIELCHLLKRPWSFMIEQYASCLLST